MKQTGERTFAGWASVEIKDSEGELLPMAKLRETMPDFMERGSPISVNHTDLIVGRVKDYDFRRNEETGEEGLWVEAEVFGHYPVDDEMMAKLQSGEMGELSIGGTYELDENGVATFIAPTAIAITEKGINDEAKIEKVAGKAKEGESMGENEQPDPDKLQKESEQAGKVPEQLNKDPGAEQEDPVAKMQKALDQFHVRLSKLEEGSGTEELANRLSKIEGILDGLASEEEQEKGSTDKLVEKTAEKKEPGKEKDDLAKAEEEKKKEKVDTAIFAKQAELDETRGRLQKLEAQLGKGVRKTVPSSQAAGGSTADEGLKNAWKMMGLDMQ